ncbi:VWA domain-containing protein [Ruegeria sp. WL0004]|uniref:VWA domain-containing protein n=1 Tax=Ruegeria marisflavi TaxID=2984152 RepID=A0ABT2WW57_9RHOB|nr:VWA domain-containing protein [Ruegeria sp. WL0004]MCU9840134.1 VWA domain-containing protein [Ruegeria sp. WL0004]
MARGSDIPATKTPGRAALVAALLFAGLLPASATGEVDCTSDAMIVFDASGSMAEMGYNGLDRPRILDARKAMHDTLPRIAALRRLGLVTYGAAMDGDTDDDLCKRVSMTFAPSPNAAGPILNLIDGIEPDGNTALTEAVNLAARVFDQPPRPGVIVLVTDGEETCGGAPCALAADLARDTPGLTVHVIGFRVRSQFFGWEGGDGNPTVPETISPAECLAQATGGEYVSTETVEELIRALNQTLGCPLYGALAPVRTP